MTDRMGKPLSGGVFFRPHAGADILFGAWLSGLLLLVYWIYSFGHTAGFQFDDLPNLTGLETVVNGETAWHFIWSGESGPGGRPMALASLLLDAASWPSDATPFRRFNTLVHLLNGVLVTWLALRLARTGPEIAIRPAFTAAIAGTLFLCHPLLASSSLMLVQRMTTMAASFVIAGMLCYVAGRQRLAAAPGSGYLMMSFGVGAMAVLGVMAKETAALLPLLAWTLEATLLGAALPCRDRIFKVWKTIFFVLPAIAMLAYVALRWPEFMRSYQAREFDLGGRLLSEARAVADYLYLLIRPTVSGLAPFRDDFAISTGLLSPPTTLPSILLVAGLGLAGVLLRKRFPLFAFAVFWFGAGHLLESTVLPLEPYFHHRNYVPAIGPIFFLAGLAGRMDRQHLRLAIPVVTVYALLLAFVLHEISRTWGDEVLAGELWYQMHPQSVRAAQFLAIQYTNRGDYNGALSIIDRARQANRDNSGLALQSVLLGCLVEPQTRWISRVDDAVGTLRAGRMSLSAIDATRRLVNVWHDGSCKHADADVLHRILDAMSANPQFSVWPEVRQQMHFQRSRVYDRQRLLNETMHELEAAYAAKPALYLVLSMGVTLASAGLVEQGRQRMNEALAQTPSNPFLGRLWRNSIMETAAQLDSVPCPNSGVAGR